MADKVWTDWFGTKDTVSVTDLADKLIKLPKKETFSKELISLLVEIAITTPGSAKVNVNQWKAFLGRFGPYEVCVEKSVYSLFMQLSPPLPHRWFHGNQDRKAAAKIMTQDEASMGSSRESGHFLVRYSDKYPTDFVLSYSKVKDEKLCYKSVVIKNSLSGYFMQTEKRGPAEFFPTVHALIESERKRQRLNHSIISKIYRSLVAQQRRPSGATYQRWNPSGELPEEPVKSGTESSNNAYSIWNGQALPADRSTSSASSSSTPTPSGDAYQSITSLQTDTSTSGSVYSTFSDSTSPYATWQEGDKSKSKK